MRSRNTQCYSKWRHHPRQLIDRAIIDKNARIADGVVITPEGKPANLDADNYFIRDGIVVIPKNAVIPAGLWI